MKRRSIILLATILLLSGFSFGQAQRKHKPKSGRICGDPTIKCETRENLFSDSDLSFEIAYNSVVAQSRPFYAIILKSQVVKSLFSDPDDPPCQNVATEEYRLSVQKLFPRNKVFERRCGASAVLYGGYGNYKESVFIAVYAGDTLLQAKKFLTAVNKTGQFKGAYIRKLRVGLNDT